MEREIRQYLQNTEKDYATGVALYSQYGSSETLKRMFSWGKTSYNQEKLVEALKAIVVVPENDLPQYGQSSLKEAIPQIKLQDEIEKLDKTWKPLYKEASFKHSQLHHVAPEERKKLAFEILDSFEKMEPIWEKKDSIVKTGKLPEEISEKETSVTDPSAGPGLRSEPTTPVQILKRITNLTVQISKHRKNEKRAAEVKNWEKERDELKLKLQKHG